MNALGIKADGPVGAPTLVLLHAIATSSDLWTPQLVTWATTHRVLRLDLPGHGQSPVPPAGFRFADYAALVASALEGEGVTRASFVGLSFGAMVAQRLAVDRPDLVKALVFANCVARTPDPVRAMWTQRIAAVQAGGMAKQVEGTLDRWFTPSFRAGAPATMKWVEGLIRSTPAEGFIRAAEAIMQLDHLDLLGQVDRPALVISGQHDHAAPPEAGEAIAKAMPNASLAVLDAAHVSNVEQPVAFTETVCRFLADTDG